MPSLSASKVPYQKSLLHAYVLGINHIPVTTREDIERAFHQLLELDKTSYDTISLLIAPAARAETLSNPYHIPQMQMNQLQHIATVMHSMTMASTAKNTNSNITFPPDEPLSDDEINYFLHPTNQAMINKVTTKGNLPVENYSKGINPNGNNGCRLNTSCWKTTIKKECMVNQSPDLKMLLS